ncbi:MAG: hypothetical protein GKR94_21165 [Gammaproteobacteria bacterium]|nr:hypothetical protein [Gammaproteobacteria bacterium]
MNKLVMLVFGALTVGSIFLSTANIGVSSPSIDKPSVRYGSGGGSGGYAAFIGGGRPGRGK